MKPKISLTIAKRRKARKSAFLTFVTIASVLLCVFVVGLLFFGNVTSYITDFFNGLEINLPKFTSPKETVSPTPKSEVQSNDEINAGDTTLTKDEILSPSPAQPPITALNSIDVEHNVLLDMEALTALCKVAQSQNVNAFSFELKNVDGLVLFKTDNPLVIDNKALSKNSFDLNAVTKILKEYNITPIGKLTCFLDDTAPRKMSTDAISIEKNFLWLDRNMKRWLNPYSSNSCDYLTSIAKSAVENGVKVVELTYCNFPTEGKIDKINYEYNDGRTEEQVISDFIKKMELEVTSLGGQIK